MHTDAALPLYFASQAKMARKERKRFQKELKISKGKKSHPHNNQSVIHPSEQKLKPKHLKAQLLGVTDKLPKAHRVRNSDVPKKDPVDEHGSQIEAAGGVDDEGQSLLSYK